MSEQLIYLNHAGTSWPKPRVVVEAVQQAMAESPRLWSDRFELAHQAIANSLGIPNLEQLLLTPGCTSALAVGIADVDLRGRNRVLTSSWEHHAMHRPLLNLSKSGVSVEYIPASASSPLDLDILADQLSKDDVGLVAVTAAANVTGDLLPYEEVVGLAHQHDTQVMLDAAQVVGWLDLDFDALGADLIAFGGHKGLQAPWGIGGLYIADTAQLKCSSAICELSSSNQDLRPGYCDVGSVDQFALAGLHAATEWLSGIDKSTCLMKARAQIAQLESVLNGLGARCISIHASPMRMPTVAFSFNNKPSGEIAASLKALGIIVGSGLQCAPLAHQTIGTEDQGLVRLSVGLDQDEQEIQSAIEVIGQSLHPKKLD